VGWIGNRIDPDMAAVDENIATLRQLLPAPCLGVLPHAAAPQAASSKLDLTLILE
jgi:dethiobiotin synthetase